MTDARPSIGVVGLGGLGRTVVATCAAAGLPVVLTASLGTGWRADAVPDVLVDASGPGALTEVVAYCRNSRTALVECVSNLDDDQWVTVTGLAEEVPVVRATNLALGHHLQTALVRRAAELVASGPFAPVASIRERHPATKAHRPSATAGKLAGSWAAVSGEEVTEICVERSGLPVSDHEVVLTWGGETLTVGHAVGSFAAAAHGAVAAARWVTGRPPGLHSVQSMYDELMVKETPCP
ncbi:dihydrodipicolinate reductase C-terminal domain-containing protein [Actinophytocola glycyrrhizae]|uniref:Dihydrodipicolinate reductase C-terminal domain-containing protein n=1 Tax=Actinophytocola glycyrrhizae TaxID=2044873 RepID=A0ABV9S6L6_9PSEU